MFLPLPKLPSALETANLLVRVSAAVRPCLTTLPGVAWVEYAHNSLTSSVTGLSPFMAAYIYQPPLFFSQRKKFLCPWFKPTSIDAAVSGKLPEKPFFTIFSAAKRLQTGGANSPPPNQPGQKVWLCSRDLPLRATSRKLAPLVNPVAVCLKLPPSMQIQPTSNVYLFKPIVCSDLCPQLTPLHHPGSLIGTHLTWCGRSWIFSVGGTGKGTALRSALGFPHG